MGGFGDLRVAPISGGLRTSYERAPWHGASGAANAEAVTKQTYVNPECNRPSPFPDQISRCRSLPVRPSRKVCTEERSEVPLCVGPAGVFLDRVAQGHLTGGLCRIDGKPFAADKDRVRIFVSIAHGHRAHVDVETEQHPGMGRRKTIGWGGCC